jgi:hypothetical protein
LELQRAEGFTPPVEFPGHAANLHLKIVRQESCAQIAAVFLDRVGGLVFAAEKGDELPRHWGMAST